MRYRCTDAVTAVAGVATLNLRCVESGSQGNLDNGDTLEIASQITGAETTATVTATVTLGIDEESDSDYRPRVLFAQRAITGGANATDHKIWAEAVTGVKQAFPYSGRPVDEGTSYPGDRSVYVECTSDINSDGIAPAWLLADVRTAINYNINGASQAPLGITNATLFLRSISRTIMYVQISDLVVDSTKESACKSAISAALTLHFSELRPFVDGVDVVQERNDSITSITVSAAVQDVLTSYGATCTAIGVGTAVGVFFSIYVLGQGELCKLGTITYA